ncbi:MAG: 2-hydroxyacyl-CoA dehydratase [Chloroflexi bacterium]|nr:2-hydroxyacyl-CoA dehydratase [Chloroflexota bacterium]
MSGGGLTTATAERSTGLETLRQAYADRLDAWQSTPRVVGLVGNTIPVELVLACGRVPVLVAARRGRPTPHADVYMEDVIAPETKSLFESAASGDLAFLELLVLSRPYAQLYYYLKEVYRLGRGPAFPPLFMFDLMHSRREAVRAYNWARFRALIERLQRLAGQEITEGRLRDAIASTNSVRAQQRRLQELRWQQRVSGVEALEALGAGYFIAPDAYRVALGSYVDSLAERPGLSARPRLLVVTSEPLSHTGLHQAVESAGAWVVAEDDWWGSRAPGADVPLAGSAYEAVFQKAWLDTATPGVYPSTAREAWLREHALREDVDGVVFYLPPSDHQLGWDYPRLNRWLSDHGKATLLVRSDATTPDGAEAIRLDVAHFLESLG